MALVSTGELAKELGVSRGAVLKWVNAEIITPEFTTPGGHHRWDVEFVRAQLAALRKREDGERRGGRRPGSAAEAAEEGEQ